MSMLRQHELFRVLRRCMSLLIVCNLDAHTAGSQRVIGSCSWCLEQLGGSETSLLRNHKYKDTKLVYAGQPQCCGTTRPS